MAKQPAGASSGQPELRAARVPPRVTSPRPCEAGTVCNDPDETPSAAPAHGGGLPEPRPTSGSPAAPYAVCIRQVLAYYLPGAQDATKSTRSLWGHMQGNGRRTPSGHMCHHQTPCLRSPRPPARPHPAPSPDSSAKPSGPRAMAAGQDTHVARARAAGPLGPARPQASSLAGRRVEGSGSQQPEVCARAYISHQLFLPRAARKPGGPGLPLPRLVKPAQQHPRPGGALVPGCHQRLPPATGAQRRPNSLPPVRREFWCPGKTTRANVCPSQTRGVRLRGTGTPSPPHRQSQGRLHRTGAFICTYTLPPCSPRTILLKPLSDGSRMQTKHASECRWLPPFHPAARAPAPRCPCRPPQTQPVSPLGGAFPAPHRSPSGHCIQLPAKHTW